MTEHTDPHVFLARHLGPTPQHITAMLEVLGLDDLDDLMAQAMPAALRDPAIPEIPALSEPETWAALRALGARNRVMTSLLGMGYYDTWLPPVIRRNVLENPAWYSAYTPYQAEISQGRLEALLTFQQMIVDLTGFDIANASLLDEATACAEALTMTRRLVSAPSRRFLVDRDCHPQNLAVLRTRAAALDLQICVIDPWRDLEREPDYFGVLLQYPGSSGALRDLRSVIERAHHHGALVTVATDLLAATLLEAPGAQGADIAVGTSQRFGLPLGYGGPHAGFIATRDALKRSLPGRLVGVSQDALGQRALRLALQTREQHIRRDKATSNICTAQVLPAMLSAFYAMYHGPEGLSAIARRVHRYACALAAALQRAGYRIVHEHFFDTLVVVVPAHAADYAARAEEKGFNLRLIDADHLGISLDETTTAQTVAAVAAIFDATPLADARVDVPSRLPEALWRRTPFLQHALFHDYRTETAMLRYLAQLARRDLALDRAMIPLGSCTMKLNPATALQALSDPSFTGLHPFAPRAQAQGYHDLFAQLIEQLCRVTGFAAFSLQPNAGSQGEYAGMLVIRRYHEARGETQRRVCLIPQSAHGTNPASATLAGFHVVELACDADGNVDLGDLQRQLDQHGACLAALMITYPSTHGVYETHFRALCDAVHAYGGQVYLDGANFNALVGWCRPGLIGADVAHFNLHKTFGIPHGGGGPGAGPIGVREHLAPFLPTHPFIAASDAANDAACGAIAGAPWGSASLYTIPWAYIAMLGTTGLRRTTQIAVLNANYLAKRLAPYYPILFTGSDGWVAHECIIDLRAFKKTADITVEDVAKRLIDFGFHAPTVAFPVADTLMIEPTESEDKTEIDRFCAALIAIRAEIDAIAAGQMDRANNPLKNAPHTADLLLRPWTLPYSPTQAFFPDGRSPADKYWPPVARVDHVYGDRHLQCRCF